MRLQLSATASVLFFYGRGGHALLTQGNLQGMRQGLQLTSPSTSAHRGHWMSKTAIHEKDTASPAVSKDSRVTKEVPHQPLPGSLAKSTGTHRVATGRKKWGVDNDQPEEYWFNSHIHTLGNTGFLGAVHAAISPLSTKMIDILAYDGKNIRDMVAKELADSIHASKARVLDLCCGVGISTRALVHAFPDAETVIGLDTSPEMISMARLLSQEDSILVSLSEFVKEHFRRLQIALKSHRRHFKNAYEQAACKCATFTKANAENTPFERNSFDLVTIMYAFHEAPREGRKRILHEARRLLHRGGTLALIDISPDYTPSETMLAGEPYVLEYQKNIDKQLRSIQGFGRVAYKALVPGHVSMWLLKRH